MKKIKPLVLDFIVHHICFCRRPEYLFRGAGFGSKSDRRSLLETYDLALRKSANEARPAIGTVRFRYPGKDGRVRAEVD